jgi:hypothetical protein
MLKDYFDELYHEDGKCYVNSYAKHYDLERIMDVLACFKKGEISDEIIQLGESGIEIQAPILLFLGNGLASVSNLISRL